MRRTPGNTQKNPRQLALDVLARLDRTGVPLDSILEESSDDASFSDPRDRALFHTLVFGTLQWRARLDWVIRSFSKKPLRKIDPNVLNILRMGLFQAVFLDRIPVSAAVNTSVDLAKKKAPPWVVGFVNAVLRNSAKGWDSVPLPSCSQDPAKHLAVGQSLPRWLVHRWIERFGFFETEALCRALNQIPPITGRVNTLLGDREQLIESLRQQCGEVRTGALSPDAVVFRSPAVAVSELAGHRKGWFQVQDEAAQLVVRILDPQPGERVLDACAGLGGKTGHIAQRMKNRGMLLAVDKDAAKGTRLEREMARLGAKIVRSKIVDLEAGPPDVGGPFHRVLLDAPCSGLGVIRRNPDARWKTIEKDLSRFHRRQGKLLERAADLVSPSGLLVYSVCTCEPEENEFVVDRFLEDHPAFSVCGDAGRRSRLPDECFDSRGFFRTYPHRHQTDGFFAAALIRRA